MALSDKQARFVEEYLVDLNATQAAIRAGYSEDTARQQGSRLLTDADIADAVAAAMTARSERVGYTSDQLLRDLVDIATVDANELVEHRIGCCRYCWGLEHRYQYTPREWERVEADRMRLRNEAIEKGKEDPGPADPQGGLGFNATRAANAACPECFGEGEGRPVFKDSAKASPAARRLYAGVKVTRDGMEMKLHDRLGALDKIAKHLGFYAPERHEHTGKDGKPIQTESTLKPDLADLDQDERDLLRALVERRLGKPGGDASGA